MSYIVQNKIATLRNHPRAVLQKYLLRMHYRLLHWFLKNYVRVRYKNLSKDNAIKIMDQEWDYLIVLDTCRYDLFRELYKNASYVISGGSGTQEWLKWNFDGKFEDVIYIAGNPHLSTPNLVKLFGFNPFYKVVEVWDFGWDSTFKTVAPEEVTIAALETSKRYPNKRMIIHYNQPHHPFLKDRDLLRLDEGTWSQLKGEVWGGRKTTVWDLAQRGEVPIEKVWRGYKENLKLVMEEVQRLINKLRGKVILTSDHGNHIGEYKVYGHHVTGLRTKELVKVPWLTIKDQETRSAFEKQKEESKFETQRIKERIRQLKKKGKV